MQENSKPSDRAGYFFSAVLLVFVFGFLYLFLSVTGPGITPDSASYIACSKSFISAAAFVTVEGRPFTEWPPFYPILLSLFYATADRIDTGAALMNALLLSILVFLSYLFLARNYESRLVRGVFVLTVLFSVPLLTVYFFLWSEILFLPLVLGSIVVSGRYRKNETAGRLLLLIGITALACLTKYMGVALGLALFLVLLYHHCFARRKGSHRPWVYLFCSFLPLGLWLLRNQSVAGSLTGERGPSSISMFRSVHMFLDTLSSWFIYRPVPANTRILVVALPALAAACFVIKGRARVIAAIRDTHAIAMPCAVYIAVHSIATLVLANITAFDAIDSRILSPIYIPLFYLICLVFSIWLKSGKATKIAIFVACLWVINIVFMSSAMLRHTTVNGPGGFRFDDWLDKEVIAFVESRTSEGGLYSNIPEIVYLTMDRYTRLSPRRHLYGSPGSSTQDMEKLAADLLQGESKAFLVWFPIPRSYLYDLKALEERFHLHGVFSGEEGMVFEISPVGEKDCTLDR